MKGNCFRADRLKKIMEDNGVAITELGIAVNSVKPLFNNLNGYIKNIINGYIEPTLNVLKVICEVCNCSADYLLGISDTPNRIGR